MVEYVAYEPNKRFPEEKYISSEDRVNARLSPDSFDVIITLREATSRERRAIACGEIYVSIFVHKQIPHILMDYGVYTCDYTINILKLCQMPISEWLINDSKVIKIFLLEEDTGNILNMRLADFPLMEELKYLLSLQTKLEKEEIDNRIADAEHYYTIKDMARYSIFFGKIPATQTLFIDIAPDEDIIF